jgi:hypothetical protein
MSVSGDCTHRLAPACAFAGRADPHPSHHARANAFRTPPRRQYTTAPRGVGRATSACRNSGARADSRAIDGLRDEWGAAANVAERRAILVDGGSADSPHPEGCALAAIIHDLQMLLRNIADTHGRAVVMRATPSGYPAYASSYVGRGQPFGPRVRRPPTTDPRSSSSPPGAAHTAASACAASPPVPAPERCAAGAATRSHTPCGMIVVARSAALRRPGSIRASGCAGQPRSNVCMTCAPAIWQRRTCTPVLRPGAARAGNAVLHAGTLRRLLGSGRHAPPHHRGNLCGARHWALRRLAS